MDFKVAGTQDGITGIQLDLKINGISEAIIRGALAQARDTRIEILKKILMTIREPRADISVNAPRLLQIKIDSDKIGLVIGPGGKMIRAIQEETGTVIEIEEDGTVTVASSNGEWAQAAINKIEALTANVKIGKIYDGKVASIKDFGAFVEILPGRDGLCHISELANGYVGSVTEVCAVGDTMKVLVIDVDDHDRVKLSRRKAFEQLGIEDDFVPGERPPAGEGNGGGDRSRGDREPRRGGGGGRSGGGGGRGRR
jgi:polyribonucleotide nucleotidyltransferase